MPYLICRHKVADFSQWKRVFDSHRAAQERSGLKVEKALRNIDDPSEVFLVFKVTDIEKARCFVTSSDVPKAQQVSGVIDNPDIYFLE